MYDHGLKKVHKPDVPTICVGNITVGGTGKTPHTEMLIRTLLGDDYWGSKNLAVLSRGYKRKTKGFQQVMTDGSATQYGDEPLQIKTFTEKPDKTLAEIFISTGEFLWNAGIFLWKAQTIRQEMEKHTPQITTQFIGWEGAIGSKIEREFIQRAYTGCPNLSLGYGVMEKTDRAWIYPAKFGWQDIGTWESLYNYIPKDNNGNAVSAEKTLLENASGNLIVSPEKKKLIAVKGLEDYMIIDTEDALVICPKDDKKFKDFISGIAMPEFEKYR